MFVVIIEKLEVFGQHILPGTKGHLQIFFHNFIPICSHVIILGKPRQILGYILITVNFSTKPQDLQCEKQDCQFDFC